MTAGTKTPRFTFILMPGYSALSFTHALVVLQLANKHGEGAPFEIRVLSEDGTPVTDALGGSFPIDGPLDEPQREDFVVLVTGDDVERQNLSAVSGFLRKAERIGATLCALYTGAYVLAKAGLLDGKRATIHWEKRQAFMEEFPEVDLTEYTFTSSASPYCSSGGTSAIDLMLFHISQLRSEKLANLVAGFLNYTSIRVIQHSARIQAADRVGFRHPKLSEILALMETNLEEPLRPSDLAKTVNISTRQLERLFRRYLSATPKKYYTDLRLQRAQQLLLQTNMTVTAVGVACGFNTASHFSRLFRARFGTSPHRLRGDPEKD
ncbi:GlxA family transcriptional regulator [Cognatishimia activa]|uniref:GlxA family transcriptional regulator n=1 Tax=Cognatishimia activa TaxID=1715691 RepID=A0A975I627_9RHOB|nr:GlxA family transcriptional regulator [Cognatishimia activa]QTN34464.1 GlxA family transcriptional regulator [Cognatishimia activa]